MYFKSAIFPHNAPLYDLVDMRGWIGPVIRQYGEFGNIISIHLANTVMVWCFITYGILDTFRCPTSVNTKTND